MITSTFNRIWAMPSKDTFDVKPIAAFVHKYLSQSKVSIDPFARNKRWATHTNDLNPETKAQHHLTALAFLDLLRTQSVKADLIIFDPPYSINQAKVCYESFGAKTFTQYDAQNVVRWTDEKEIARDLLTEDGVFLQFGWNSMGLGRKYGFELFDLLLVCHGPAHNDTICIAEHRVSESDDSPSLFPETRNSVYAERVSNK